MYSSQFDYYRATSLEEAFSLLGQHPGAKLLAGGHSLLPALKLRLSSPSALIDIGRIPGLSGIQRHNGTAHIGALTTHAMVAAASGLPDALTDAAAHIGDPAVRNRGTVGGNIAHADPASDLPTVLTALGATVQIAGPQGKRSVKAADFFIDLFVTALEENEIVTGVDIPVEAGAGSAYVKMPNPASRYALIGAAAVVKVANGRCTHAGVAVGGLTSKATRASAVEAALVGQPLNADSINAAAARVAGDLGDDVMGDIHASANYRRAVAPVFVARAITSAAARAT